MNEPTKENGFVYFVQMGADGPIKIGRAGNPAKRVAGMVVYSPYRLRLLLLVKDGTLEKAFHKRFKSFRMRGEWFRPEPEVLAYIAALISESKESMVCGRCNIPVNADPRISRPKITGIAPTKPPGRWDATGKPFEYVVHEVEHDDRIMRAVFGDANGISDKVGLARLLRGTRSVQDDRPDIRYSPTGISDLNNSQTFSNSQESDVLHPKESTETSE